MEFRLLPEFEKDLKYLQKRFRTLSEDIDVLKKALAAPVSKHPDNVKSVRVAGFKVPTPIIIKLRKVTCRALKNKGSNTGLRLIYSYDAEHSLIHLIEIYYKGDKESEDRDRISNFLSREFLE